MKVMKQYDIISGRDIVIGRATDGARFELVRYGEVVHVGIQLENGNWAQFVERATIDDMIDRLTDRNG